MIAIPPRTARISAAQFDILNARASALRAQGRHVISLGQALPGFGPPASAIAAASAALQRADTHVYSADAGLESLRQILVRRLRDTSGIEADADDVIVTTGGNQAFMLALMTLVDARSEVVLPSPYFANHEMAVRAVGAIPVEAPLEEATGFAVTWAAIAPYLTKNTRAVVICSPSNPTGAVAAGEALDSIARELRRRGIVLLADETYARFVYDVPHASAAALENWRDNVVVLNTFSKTFGMTGWRVGYMLADRRICDQAIKIQDAMVICAPVVCQHGVEAALREAWDYPLQLHAALRTRRRALADDLEQIPRLHWTPTQGAFFAFVRVDGCVDSLALSHDILERAGVVTIPGAIFGRAGEGFLRLSYGAVSQEGLQQALARLGEYFSAD